MTLLALLLAFSASEKAAAARITAAEISAHVRFLSDDQLEGRKPGQPGDELAIKYLASQLEAMGYRPAGDNGTFLQPVPLVELSGEIPREANFNPPFKGEGVRVWYGRWDYKYLNAAKHGAAGAIIIHTTPSAGYPWQVVVTSWGTPHQNLPPGPDDKFMEFRGWITESAALRLAQAGAQDLDGLRKSAESKDFRPVPLGSTMSLEMPVHLKTIQSANVIGILPGSDPSLKQTAVLYTAHHDHLGSRPVPPGQDGIFNGALDNASGCATVAAIARAATFARPRRSILVAFVTAEEQGLLGSEWLARHPPIPANQLR